MVQKVRTHDKKIYLKEERYENPKEIFKIVYQMAETAGGLAPGKLVADIGCATGEFIYYLKKQRPDCSYLGIDVLPELIEQARARVPGVEFRVGSILESQTCELESFDTVFVLGVLGMFDDFRPGLRNALSWCRRGGRVYLFGVFNPFPVDVWIGYHLVDDPDPNRVESGWNLISKASYSRFIDQVIGPGKHAFRRFEMPFDLSPRTDDPIRSWTFKDETGRRLITNGVSVIQNQEFLEINP